MNQRAKQMGKKQFFHYSKCRADWLKKRKKNMQKQSGDAALGTMEALTNAFTSQNDSPEAAGQSASENPVGPSTNS